MNNTHYDIVKQGHDAITKWVSEHATDILDLRGVNLRGADLRGADLTGSDLTGADLTGADPTGADLTGACLWNASLTGAYLGSADLTGANMRNTIGNDREVKTVQTDLWTVTYTADVMQIECRRHAIKDWLGFDDATISARDSKALEWWMRWKPILQQIIVTSPATPTNNKEEK